MIPAIGESLEISIEQEWNRRYVYHVIGPSILAFRGPYLEGETPCLKSKPTT